MLQDFAQWLVVVERQAKTSVLMLRSDRGGEFLGKEFTAFVDDKGIVHNLTCPVVTTSDVVFYETMSLEVWKLAYGPASGQTHVNRPTDTSTTTLPLLAEVGELAHEDAEVICPPSPSPVPPAPPLVADLHGLTSTSANGNEGSSGASRVAPAKSIAGGRRDATRVSVGATTTPTGEQHAGEVHLTLVEPAKEASAGKPPMREQPRVKPTKEQSATGQPAGEPMAWEKLAGTPIVPGLWHSGRERRPPDFVSYHTCLPSAAYTTVYDEVDDDLLYDNVDLPELNPDMHTDLEHRWDIATMMVKEVVASWKGKAVKAAVDEEIRSLVSIGT
ncbi:unnamed protein product [Closterium sp. NIES-54]